MNNYLKSGKEQVASIKTTRRVYRRAGFVARIKVKKPFLKAEHKKRRLKFAKKFKDWNVEDWMHVI